MRSGRGDRLFAGGVTGLAFVVPLTLAGITLLMIEAAWPAITRYGLDFLSSSTWDPVKEVFGAAAYLYGTLVTTAIALVLAAPVAVGAAIYLTEYAPFRARDPLAFVIELLAYVPSIVFGLWALFVLVPLSRERLEPFLQSTLGAVPLILGVARAFGETMAVTMVVGNASTAITPSLFTPGYTMASAIANQFTEAVGKLYFSAIVEVAVLLLFVALIVNGLGRL